MERCDAVPGLRIALRQHHEHADAPHALALLRARRERPCCRTADKGDEFPPPHGTSPRAETPGKLRLSHSEPTGATPARHRILSLCLSSPLGTRAGRNTRPDTLGGATGLPNAPRQRVFTGAFLDTGRLLLS